MNFETYCRRLEAASSQATVVLLTTRAIALRKAMDDGVVQEGTAIKALHSYAKELDTSGKEWRELDKLMAYTIKEKGIVKQSRHRCHSPEVVRTMRGDFDGPCYRQSGEDKEVDGGMALHHLYIPMN